METANKVFEPRIPRRTLPKKRIAITVIAVVLAVALLVGLVLFLIPRPAAISYEGIVVDSEMYAFWYSMLKTEFIRYYLHDNTGTNKDKASTWDSPCVVEGKTDMTWGEFCDAEIHRAIKMKLVKARLYDSLGLEMADNQRRAIDTYYAEMVAYGADGDGAKMRELLNTYKTSEAAMRRCAILDMKADLLERHLAYYADAALEGGDDFDGYYLTAAELNRYYGENYKRVKLVYVNHTTNMYGAIENGVRVEKPLHLVEGVGARNDQDMAELDAYVANGGMTPEEFEKYIVRSDEAIHEVYPNGVYFTLQSDLKGVTGLALQELYNVNPGKLMKAETTDGTCYIFGYPTLNGEYRDEKNADFFGGFYEGAAEMAVAARAEALIDKVSETVDGYRNITAYTVPHNTHFKLCTLDN